MNVVCILLLNAVYRRRGVSVMLLFFGTVWFSFGLLGIFPSGGAGRLRKRESVSLYIVDAGPEKGGLGKGSCIMARGKVSVDEAGSGSI